MYFDSVFIQPFLENGDRRFPTMICDPCRIIQDACDPSPFYEPNVILVPEVTRERRPARVDLVA